MTVAICGVSNDSALKAVFDDLRIKYTYWFDIADANDRNQKFFLENTICLDDTPALNSTLDVIGPTKTILILFSYAEKCKLDPIPVFSINKP